MGLSKPADPPSPTVRELVIIWAFVLNYTFLATEYKIWEVPLSMEPPRTLLTTNTVNTRPAIGKDY
jgi:hypothetical protein